LPANKKKVFMKKIIIRVLIGLAIVLVLAIVAVGLFLDAGIKRGIETFGPKLTKTDIKLQSVRLSLLTGSGAIKGLVVGNPEGFHTPSAISVGSASLSLKPASLLSDKVVIKSINLQDPEITLETGLHGNNLNKLMSNVQAATGGTETQPAPPSATSPNQPAKPGKKLEVDSFVITGGKVHVSLTGLGGKELTVPLPAIHLTDLGTGPEGITPAELTKTVLNAIMTDADKAASGAASDVGQGAANVVKDVTSQGTGAVQNISRGINGLFKKH
jgi:uncharacterized protein involved in outer membrane biogenesis